MQLIANVCIAIAAVLTLVYLHALVKLYNFLRVERPALVDRRGSLSFFYTAMPRIADPNVGFAVVNAAFHQRSISSCSKEALRYARRVRYSLSFGLLLYLAGFTIFAIGAT
jgi:hypothetical protein